MIDRVPPQDMVAEQAVLGSMLVGRDAVSQAVDALVETDFYSAQHQYLFRVIRGLHRRDVPIDLVMVQGALQDGGHLEEAGGLPYLLRLQDEGLPAMQEHYIGRVLEQSQRRELMAMAADVARRAGAEDPMTMCEEVAKTLGRIQRTAGDGFEQIGDVLGRVIDEIDEQMKSDHHTWGIPSEIRRLDELISGWTPSSYTVIGARPRIGKTAFAWQQAVQAAEAGGKVLFFSLEMAANALGRRMLSSRLEIELSQVMGARFERSRMENVVEMSAAASDWKLWICERADLTIGELRAQARRMATIQRGLDLIVVDYLQLLKAGYRCSSRNEEIGEVSRGLKALAQELRVPVIVLSQLNRECEREKRWPRLSDLRDSGSVEQDADLVLFIVWPIWMREWAGTTPEAQREARGKRVLYVAKQRNGDTGKIEVSWSGAYQRFAALEASREGPASWWIDEA